MNVSEKAAYIKGLIDGMSIDTSKDEGKVLAAMANLLEDLALSIQDLEDETATLNEYIEEIDEDLGDVEEYVYDEDDCDCDCCCDDDDCDCCDDDCLEVECPACENTVCIGFDEIDDNGEAECPCCGAILEFEIEEEEEIEE